MIETVPKVFLLAETRLLSGNVLDWLGHFGVSATTEAGHDGEKLCELAGRRCYKSFAPGLNPNIKKIRDDSEKYHRNIQESGHGSVYEHATVTFAFEDVSRVFTHELVRHRVGCAYSQESLRYVRLDELRFRIPDSVSEHFEIVKLFQSAVANSEWVQRELSREFDLDEMDFKDKKKFTSLMRRLAPMGLSTGIVATFNLRALRHIIEQRTAPAAEEEMRYVFHLVASIVIERYSFAFRDFCPTGTQDEIIVAGVRCCHWKPEHSKI